MVNLEDILNSNISDLVKKITGVQIEEKNIQDFVDKECYNELNKLEEDHQKMNIETNNNNKKKQSLEQTKIIKENELIDVIKKLHIEEKQMNIEKFLSEPRNILIIYETELLLAVDKDFFEKVESNRPNIEDLYPMNKLDDQINGHISGFDLNNMILSSDNIFFLKNENNIFSISYTLSI